MLLACNGLAVEAGATIERVVHDGPVGRLVRMTGLDQVVAVTWTDSDAGV